MQRNWAIKDLLLWTTRYFLDRDIQDARLEAELLLAQVLGKDRVYLYANYEKPINQQERSAFRELIQRRSAGEPLAYIMGQREFMSLMFRVNPQVLVPRPETEMIVETALQLAQTDNIVRICDVGTGSGAIAVSLALYLPGSHIYAVDVSPTALETAAANAREHQVTIDFRQGDLLGPLGQEGHLDLVAANLPYVTAQQLQNLDPGVRDYEPHLALLATGDGLDIYRRLAPQAGQLLRPGGYILWEIDPAQAEAVALFLEDFEAIEILPDAAGRLRMVKARRRA